MFCIYSRYTHAQTDEPIVIHSACYIAKLNTNIYYICMHTSNISHMMHALPYLSLSCHCSPPLPSPLPEPNIWGGGGQVQIFLIQRFLFLLRATYFSLPTVWKGVIRLPSPPPLCAIIISTFCRQLRGEILVNIAGPSAERGRGQVAGSLDQATEETGRGQEHRRKSTGAQRKEVMSTEGRG